MTASTEAGKLDSDADRAPLGDRWREEALREQQAAMPRGDVVLTCSAPLAVGGLGRHLRELTDAQRGPDGATPLCICADGWVTPDGAAARERVRRHEALPLEIPTPGRLLSRLPLPLPPGVLTWAHMSDFDSRTARSLPSAEHLIAFNGQALRQMRVARKGGYESVALVSANSHMRHVQRRHARARERYPLEGSWTAHMLRRNLAEYALAERVYCATDYIRDSFLQQGFPAERLVRFPLTPDPRYAPATPAGGGAGAGEDAARPSSRFEIVYVGSLHVHKGVPLLIDAVRRLRQEDIRLRLVGGWGTRGMRRFVQAACAADSRIAVTPGDPLPHLRAAALCVHPAYEDGFGYAPAEALACGVPVLVSEDTGMKELIDSPRRGLTLPTGDLDALAQAIDAAYRGELFGG
jgi:glycosyltransferase involved in cell wall biosynthesis